VNIPPRGQISPLGTNFTPGDKFHPWGQTMLLKTGLRNGLLLFAGRVTSPYIRMMKVATNYLFKLCSMGEWQIINKMALEAHVHIY
jgi:hypothetical protein